MHSERFSAWLSPSGGGTITELIHFAAEPDLTDVLTRRREAYHEEAVLRRDDWDADVAGAVADAAPSIHDTEAMASLERLPPADPAPRTLVVDRVLAGDLGREAYEEGDFTPIWTWSGCRASGPVEAGDALEWSFESRQGPRVRKTIRIDEHGALKIMWRWEVGEFP
ncbi:MAG: DUF1926 domain-containing protein, partial [Gemmatimonadetes bacterium]|nr:DUF1926 domain-containing protein [Gemmatimonadota bacterium]NIU29393.1 DUF1926 domain-containing protein [Gemmatimonadota bacterium]NIV59809.1 DUF1926 domain-containing protein [Gemmatimonadota bacterium]NIW62458.1 DUF1926 domain-containing protein [Gemmatimonadota bacterium]NIX37852.1 DUF1926 domain-containing protein [Gemmatimonadota bacterium]